MKNLLKVIVCLTVLLIGLNPSLFVEAQENVLLKDSVDSKVLEKQSIDFYAVDITPPQLDISSIKVSQSQLKPGDKVTISMKITDDLSGVNRVQLEYRAPLSGKNEMEWMTYNPTTKSYEWTKFITDETESGTWKIDFLCMRDNRENGECINNIELNSYNGVDLSKGNFTVSGTGANVDITPPQLDISSIKVSQSQLKEGDKVTVSMKITDDLSGVNRVQLEYRAPLSGKNEMEWMIYNSTTKSYEWTKFITDETESGTWKIDFLCMRDNRENGECINNVELNSYNGVDLSKGNFTVSGTGANVDITPPQLDISSIKVSQSQLKEGDKVTVSMKITDDLSGVNRVQLEYRAPLSGKNEMEWMTYNPTTKRYEWTKFITDETEWGTWKIDFLCMRDNRENGECINNVELNSYNGVDLSKGNFIVSRIEKVGWVKENNTWYYYDESGKMVTGWLQEGNTWYYLKSNGAMATGWEQVSGKWYYFNESGKMQTGWLQEGNTWYYLKSSGAMATGWEKVNGTWYYFNPSGKMATGWLQEGSTWYYLKSSGAMVTGWEKIGHDWYYFYSSGKMATNTVIGGWKITSSGKAYKL